MYNNRLQQIQETFENVKKCKPFTTKTKKHFIDQYTNEGICIFSFEEITIQLHKITGKEVKTPKMRKNWIYINQDNHINAIDINHRGFGFISGYKSGITVIDIDDINVYYDMVQHHPSLLKYRTILTNKGVHIYCKYDPSILTHTDALKNYKKVDIRNDDAITFCAPTQYKLLDGTIITYIDIGGEIKSFPKFIKDSLKQSDIRKIHKQQNIGFFVDNDNKITIS